MKKNQKKVAGSGSLNPNPSAQPEGMLAKARTLNRISLQQQLYRLLPFDDERRDTLVYIISRLDKQMSNDVCLMLISWIKYGFCTPISSNPIQRELVALLIVYLESD